MMINNLRSRVRKVFRYLEDEKTVDLILIRNGVEPHIDLSFFYLTGLASGLFESCSVIAYPGGETILFTSRLEEESARRDTTDDMLRVFDNEAHHTSILRKEIGKMTRIGINARELTHANFLALKRDFPNAQFLDVSDAIIQARSVKDDEEISLIKKSAEIVSRSFSSIPEEMNEGITEIEIASILNSKMQKNGASSPSFETIVAFGPHSAEPHYSPRRSRLKRGDYALFDFGARYMRYCSDMTRTLVFGKASSEMRQVYQTVMEAQNIGIDALQAGEKASNVHGMVAKFIDSTKYKGRFTHSTGHTIGLSVHDGGLLSSSSEIILEDGMVFTIEPGIYIPTFGGVRIEDDFLVRNRKAEVLTKAPRELMEI